MTSEGQDPSVMQQMPSRPASPPKDRSQTPKIFTPVAITPDITEIPPSKRRSMSPMPPSAHSDSFPNPFNAPAYHSHGFPQSSNSHSAPPEPTNPNLDLSKQGPRPYSRPGPPFKMHALGPKIGHDGKPSPEDAAMLDAVFAKEEERKRGQATKSRKGSRAGSDGHRRTSSAGLQTIPYIPKLGFRNILSNEPQQTPLMQAIHNPISLDTGTPPAPFGPMPRMHSPHRGLPKLGLNTQFGSRTGSPEPGSSATPTTAASPGSPMNRRKSRAQGDGSDKPPGSAKPRARQRSLLPKATSIQFESVPFPYPNSESSVFVQVSPRNTTNSLQFQPPLVPFPPPPPQHHSHQLPPPHHGSPPPLAPAGMPGPPHGMYMSPVGPPGQHFGPPPGFGPPFGMHPGMHSPSNQHQTLPPPPRPPQQGSGNPFSSNGAHPPPEFRPIDYGHPRGPPPSHHHDFSPIMQSVRGHPDELRKALFPHHDRPQERRLSSSRPTPFSGAPSTFMDDVPSPTAAPHYHSNSTFPTFERRDQPIVAPKSPSPSGQQHHPDLPPKNYPLGPPLQFIAHSSSSLPPYVHQQPSPLQHHPSPPIIPQLTSPNKESSNPFFPPITPTTARKKNHDRSKSISKTPVTNGPVRVSMSSKSQPPPPSPKTPKTAGEGSSAGRDNPVSPAAPMIKRRSAYVAGGGIKTTDLALPKPEQNSEQNDAQTPATESQPATTPVDPEVLLTLNKPRKRKKANPSALRMREKEVDDDSPEEMDDVDVIGQLAREMSEAAKRDGEEEEEEEEEEEQTGEKKQRLKGKLSKEAKEGELEKPVTKKRGRKTRAADKEANNEDEADGQPAEEKSTGVRRGVRRGLRSRTAASPASSEEDTDSDNQEATGTRRTRKRTNQDAGGGVRAPKRKKPLPQDDPFSDACSSVTSTGVSWEWDKVNKKFKYDKEPKAQWFTDEMASLQTHAESSRDAYIRRGHARSKLEKEEKEGNKTRTAAKIAEAAFADAADEDIEFWDSGSEDEVPNYQTLMVNGKATRVPFTEIAKHGGLRKWWTTQERPKFFEGDSFIDQKYTISRIKDHARRHHLKNSNVFFMQPNLVEENYADGWTDNETDLGTMGVKGSGKNLWYGEPKLSDAALEKGFQQLERDGSVEPLSAAETPRHEFPTSTARQLTTLSQVEKYDDNMSEIAMTPLDASTAVGTPMAGIESGPSPFDVAGAALAPPGPHLAGFSGMRGTMAPPGVVGRHTSRKRKYPMDHKSARGLQNMKWVQPHFEGRSKEIWKHTLDNLAHQRKTKESENLQSGDVEMGEAPTKPGKPGPKKGGKKGRKKGKPDLKNLAYAREVRKAKLAGSKVPATPGEDNLSVVSSQGGEGAFDDGSNVTEDDDLSENSDHDSDWPTDDDADEDEEWRAMDEKYQKAMEDPQMKALLEGYGGQLFPAIFEVPEDATRNRGADFTEPEVINKALEAALDIGDDVILQEVLTSVATQIAMVHDERTKLDNYRVRRGWAKPEEIAPPQPKKQKSAEESGGRYSTRNRSARKADDDDDDSGPPGLDNFGPFASQNGNRYLSGYATPEQEVRAYKPRGRGGRGSGSGRGGTAGGSLKIATGPSVAPSGRGRGRGRGGRGRGRGRGNSAAS